MNSFHPLRPLVIPESLVMVSPVFSEIWVVPNNSPKLDYYDIDFMTEVHNRWQ